MPSTDNNIRAKSLKRESSFSKSDNTQKGQAPHEEEQMSNYFESVLQEFLGNQVRGTSGQLLSSQKLVMKKQLHEKLKTLYNHLVSAVGILKLTINASQMDVRAIPQGILFLMYQFLQNFMDESQQPKTLAISTFTKLFGEPSDQKLVPMNFMLQLLLTFYPTVQVTSFNNLFCSAEFLVISMTFRAYKTTDEKDIALRLLGVFFAVITKIHTNQESLALILSTSVSSIVLISCIILNLLIDFLETRGMNQFYPQQEIQSPKLLPQLQQDVLVWQTEEISTFNKQMIGSHNGSKQSSLHHQGSRQSKQSIDKRFAPQGDTSESQQEIRSGSNNTNFVIEQSNGVPSASKQRSENENPVECDIGSLDSNHPVCNSFYPQGNDSRISNSKQAINDYFLNHLSHGFMVCKLSHPVQRKSSDKDKIEKVSGQIFSQVGYLARSMEQNLSQGSFTKRMRSQIQKQRKVKVQAFQKSEKFFNQQPFYGEITKLMSQNVSNQEQSVASVLLGNTKKTKSQIFDSGELKREQLICQSGDQSLSKSHQISHFQSSAGQGSFRVRDQNFLIDLSQTEEFLLDMKVYQPYFITNSTIIQFDGSKKLNVSPEKLSIMDILELYFVKHQTKSSLFFKVNLGDLSEIRMLQNFQQSQNKKGGFFSNPSMSGSLVDKLLNSLQKSSVVSNQQVGVMEEIKEQNNEHGSNKSGQAYQRKRSKRKPKGGNTSPSMRRPERHTSQEMNEVIWSLNNEADEIIRPRARNTSRIVGMKNNILQVDESKSSSSVDNDSSEFNLHDEDELQINKSIVNSNSSQATFKDFQESFDMLSVSNGEQKQELIKYFEFEIQQVDDIKGHKNLTFIVIKDVTKLVLGQQKFCDQIYQNAIENNFSHEQMTPLNPIETSAKILKSKILTLYLEKLGVVAGDQNFDYMNVEQINFQHLQYVIKNSFEAKQVMQMLLSIEQSAKLIWFYNTCNINRMKIKKNELALDNQPVKSLVQTIQDVLWPFEMLIVKRRHNVHLRLQIDPDIKMIADWALYQLILFNLVQNSVKYNKPRDGDIMILVKCKKLKLRDHEHVDPDLNAVLETIIIDTGIGIQKDRQKSLFIPFLELKDRLGIMKSENDNIGIGLAGSKDICVKMGGDIILKTSRPGLTAFVFKIPIKVTRQSVSSESIAVSESSSRSRSLSRNRSHVQLPQEANYSIIRLFGSERPIPEIIQEFLNLVRVFQSSVLGSELRQHQISNISQSVIAFQEINLNEQRFGFQILENISRNESGSVNQNSRRHLKKLKKRESCNSSSLSNILKNSKRFKFSAERKNSGSKNASNKPSRDKTKKASSLNLNYPNTNLSCQSKSQLELEEQKLNLSFEQQKLPALIFQESIFQNEVSEPQKSESKQSESKDIMSSDFEFEPERHPEEEEKVPNSPSSKIQAIKRASCSIKRQQDLNKILEEDKDSNTENDAPLEPLAQIEQEPVAILENDSKPSTKKRIAKPESALAFKVCNSNLDQIDSKTKNQCVNEIIYNNHKNLVYKVFSDQQLRGDEFEIEVEDEDDEDEEVQNILVSAFSKNKDILCVRLANASQESEDSGDNSYDVIEIDSSKPEVPPPDQQEEEQKEQQEEQKEQNEPLAEVPVVIRPEDFIIRNSQEQQVVNIQPSNVSSQFVPQSFNESNFSESEPDLLQDDNSQQDQQDLRISGEQFSVNDSSLSLGFNKNQSMPNSSVAFSIPKKPLDERMKQKNHLKSKQIQNDSHIQGCCTPKILCVDDGDMNLLALRVMLQTFYQITPDEAENGQIAVDMFKQGLDKECKCSNRAYKLILMDINMPVMDGIEASQEILALVAREQARLDEIQGAGVRRVSSQEQQPAQSSICNIVAITSYTGLDVKENALRVGVRKVMPKPLQSDQLREILQQYFNY